MHTNACQSATKETGTHRIVKFMGYGISHSLISLTGIYWFIYKRDTSELVWRKEALKGIWGYFRPFFDR